MLEIGNYNSLKLKEKVARGAILQTEEEEEVFLPCKDVPTDLERGESLNLFVYQDKEGKTICSLARPSLIKNTCALLEIVGVAGAGAFADWGLNEDLFIPVEEQDVDLEEGDSEVIFLFFDEEKGKLYGTTRIDDHLKGDTAIFEQGQEVDLLLYSRSDLGVEAVVNNYCIGMLYANEIFREIEHGQTLKGYVQKVRPDGKLDLNLEKPGYGNVEPNAQIVLDYLKANAGVMMLHDQSEADEIKKHLHMSKKNFKKALGLLYKQRLVTLGVDRVELVK